ncbi:MAG: ABC transporter substrate-binding protein [Clostridiales bacterium]|nr:MAG: ABC transporter substrate-binding protein [Clostridiales bacterium]
MYKTKDDAYVKDFTYSGLYEFFFNKDKTGYEVWPVMAESEPVDITKELKSVAKWAIPESAEKGYAYKIALNKNAKWDDGTVINADTYVESMKRLLNSDYVNYRASNYFTGSMQIFGAKEYFSQGAPITEDFLTANGKKYTNDEAVETGKNDKGVFTVKIGENVYELYTSLDAAVTFFGGSMAQFYEKNMERHIFF